MMLATKKILGGYVLTERFVIRVENNFKGNQFIKNLKKSLNKDTYGLKVRYSGPRPIGTNQVSTLKKNATSLRVYITTKRHGDNISDEMVNSIRRDNWDLMRAYEGLTKINDVLDQTNEVLENKLDLMLAVFKEDKRFKSVEKAFNALGSHSIA